MRKIISIWLSLLLIATSAGCGILGGSNGEKRALTVGLLTAGTSVEAAGADQQVWDTLQQMKTNIPELNMFYRIPDVDGTYAECTEALVKQGCTLILCMDGSMMDTIAAIAQNNPDLFFAVMDGTDPGLPNVACVQFALEEAVYLAGYTAAKMSSSQRLGCIYSRFTEETEQLLVSFMAGARAADSDVVFLRENILGKKDGGRLTAEKMVANGVDVLFHVDGNADSQVVRVCEENGIWSIGRNTDGAGGKSMIASGERHMKVAVRQLVEDAAEQTVQAGVYKLRLADEGVSLSVNQELIPEKVLTSINNVREKLMADEISIPGDLEALVNKYPELAENP